MNFESKFDSIMDYIEEHIEQKPNETVRIIAKEFGMTTRTLSEGFQFVTDISLSGYIRLRRVIRALKYKLAEGCALDAAAAHFGFPDQPTLSKACRELPLNDFKKVFHECLYYFKGHIYLAIVCHKNLAEILEHIYSTGKFPEKLSQEFPPRLDFPELEEFSKELHEYIIDEDPEDSLEEKCTSFDLDTENNYCDEIFP